MRVCNLCERKHSIRALNCDDENRDIRERERKRKTTLKCVRPDF